MSIKAGADVNKVNDDGMAHLHRIMNNNYQIHIVMDLVVAGAKLNMSNSNSNGWTPLNIFSTKGNIETIEYTLTADVETNMTDVYDDTPIHRASREGRHFTIVQILIRATAYVSRILKVKYLLM